MAKDRKVSIGAAAIIIFSISVLLGIQPVALALMKPMSVGELTGEANVIAIGDIKDTESRWGINKSIIYTYSTISVNRYIKGGNGEETLTIISDGGRVGSLFIWVEDTPTFLKDEKVLVFLKRDGKEYRVVGLAQGKYTLKNGVLIGSGSEKTPLLEFLQQIESVIPVSDILAQTKIQGTPGFEAAAVFLVLISAKRNRKVIISSP
ncbi:MAG: hypothetical protein OIN66_10710 [Candidatus Methanoperedens sp.]|nr:hypothetical protein [Candidatus Methanoperedens sp.]